MTKVAVIIPAFNASAVIGCALSSVNSQTRLPDEIIVVDDASTDDTVAIVESWSTKEAIPCSVVRLEENGGAATARNAGFLTTDAEVVAMLDADDVWQPNMVDDLVAALDARPDAVLAFGLREYFDEKGSSGKFQGQERLEELFGRRSSGEAVWIGPREAFQLNLKSAVTSCSAAVVRREAAISCGLFDPAFRTSQDRDFMLRLCRLGGFIFINRPVSLYRLHADNTTHSKNALKHSINGLRVLDKVYRRSVHMALADDEVESVRSALDAAVQGVLYLASKNGVKALIRAFRVSRATAARPRSPGARNLLRSCFFSLFPNLERS
jgi:glycosyltransferase involved in cell wall biosynthesis